MLDDEETGPDPRVLEELVLTLPECRRRMRKNAANVIGYIIDIPEKELPVGIAKLLARAIHAHQAAALPIDKKLLREMLTWLLGNAEAVADHLGFPHGGLGLPGLH